MCSEKSSQHGSDSERPERLPMWLRVGLPGSKDFARTQGLMKGLDLHTVCRSARCPNIFECFSKKVATFLIMGDVCTRACAFCNIGHPEAPMPAPLDPDEPDRVARAAAKLGLKYVVITSVTRDDLPDGGASHFAAVIRVVRERLPDSGVEVLIPDFRGDEDALNMVIQARPNVINHNVETVPELYSRIRPQADYAQSLELLARVAGAGLPAKSGLMVGLGETDSQVRRTLQDMAEAGCSIATVGQYLRPSKRHPKVERYVRPEWFQEYEAMGRAMGIKRMHCAPLVRSSYNAELVAGAKGE